MPDESIAGGEGAAVDLPVITGIDGTDATKTTQVNITRSHMLYKYSGFRIDNQVKGPATAPGVHLDRGFSHDIGRIHIPRGIVIKIKPWVSQVAVQSDIDGVGVVAQPVTDIVVVDDELTAMGFRFNTADDVAACLHTAAVGRGLRQYQGNVLVKENTVEFTDWAAFNNYGTCIGQAIITFLATRQEKDYGEHSDYRQQAVFFHLFHSFPAKSNLEPITHPISDVFGFPPNHFKHKISEPVF